MKFNWQTRLLFNEAPSSLLGGGGAPPAAPAADPAAPTDPIDPIAPSSPAAPAPTGDMSEFLKSLHEDHRGNAALADFKDIDGLAKSYIHAKGQIGKDSVVLPTKHATQEEWKSFMGKVGLPDKIEDYKLELYEDSTLTDEYADAFKAKAFEAGILPTQAQAMLDHMDELQGGNNTADTAATEAKLEASKADLTKTYGEALGVKITQAKNLLDEVATDEMKDYIVESGLDNDSNFIKLLVNMAEKFTGEDSFDVQTNPLGHMSPDEAQSQIDAVYANKDHPYFNTQHSGHDAAQREMEKFFKFVG